MAIAQSPGVGDVSGGGTRSSDNRRATKPKRVDRQQVRQTTGSKGSRLQKAFSRGQDATKDKQLSIRMSADFHARLVDIQNFTDARSINDVIVNALEFYDEIFQELEAGNAVTIVTQTPSGECVEYDLFEAT